MKKILVTLILTLILVVGGINQTNVLAAEKDTTGLGKSYNFVKNMYLDASEIKDGSPIFNETWLKEQIEKGTVNSVRSTVSKSYSALSVKELATALTANLGISQSLGGIYDIYSANIKRGFNLSAGININNSISQYYYALNTTITSYTHSLPNYSSNLNEYRLNLHPDYVNTVKNLLTIGDETAANNFFDMYGTHVIAKGKYGGILQLYYGIFSENIYLGGKVHTSITSSLNAGIRDVLGGSTDANFNISTVLGKYSSSVEQTYEAFSLGGKPFAGISLSMLNDSYKNWVSTVDDYPVLIDVSSDGLIPLWDLLPNEYNTLENRNKIKEYFVKYANNHNNAIYDEYKCNPTSLTTVLETVRSNVEYKITDSGRFNQLCDVIDLNGSFGFPYDNLINDFGFNKMDITIKLNMKEVDKGYQHVFLYSNENKDESGYIATSGAYEYGGETLATSYGTVTFVYKDIDAKLFMDYKKLVVRYGASGSYNDDWKNNKLQVQIRYYKGNN